MTNLLPCLLGFSMKGTLLLTVLASFMLLSIMEFSSAIDTLTPVQSIVDGETLVSPSQGFELGFFSPGNSKNRFLGIWYKNSPGTVVWVANRNTPITGLQGELTFSNNGNLVLLNQKNSIIWSSNISRIPKDPVAQLLDSGNFVLKEGIKMSPEAYLWQTFDYPSDTLLAGMKLGWNLKTGTEWFLSSWRSADDPSPGNFTYRLDMSGPPKFVIYDGSAKFAQTGPWNGLSFAGLPMNADKIFEPILVHNEDELYYTYNTPQAVTTRLTLNQSGSVQRLVWTSGWVVYYSAPRDTCQKYNHCGANGFCNISKTEICECLKGFVPESQKGQYKNNLYWPKTCVKEWPSDCAREGFLKLSGTNLPDLIEFRYNGSMNLKECEVECLNNCSCKAYSSSNISEQANGCFMWFGDLNDIKVLAEEMGGQNIYIRVPSSELEPVHHLNANKRVGITLGLSFISVFIVLGVGFLILTLWKKWKIGQESRTDFEVPFFDLVTIATATNNFSTKNVIGAGGFGPVYKGILPTGQQVAVKRLSKTSSQGILEFRNEISLIAKLQHRNLVGLLGCCIQGDESLLLYEFMPNRSLDYYIFDHERRALLAWPKRFDIILQIVRGLLYLHQDSKLQIVHRDLKTSNILLDIDLNPKISDFGLARIFEGDGKESETKRIVGTLGYMSPEYAISGIFSVKSDIFSLGALLLEILSGKKNRGFYHCEHNYNLLGHAWLLWNEGRALELLDACLEDSFVEQQVMRCIQVGLLCVQNVPESRPTMPSVAFMLENEDAVLPQPEQPGFFIERSDNADTARRKEELATVNVVTVTMLDGR